MTKMILRLLLTLLWNTGATTRAFLSLSVAVPTRITPVGRMLSLNSSVNGYHAKLSNKKLLTKLTNQVDTIRSDITRLKNGAGNSRPKDYSFAGKKDYRVRPWYNQSIESTTPSSFHQVPETNIVSPATISATVSSASPSTNYNSAAPLVGESTVFTNEELLAELQAVSAELEKVAAENTALKQMQLLHEQREMELQEMVRQQLAIYNKAERELELVKAQSLKQLEKTNLEAAARLASETAEFKARLLEAERMVLKMKIILEKAEQKLDVKLLKYDNIHLVSEKYINGNSGKVKSIWGRVNNAAGKLKRMFRRRMSIDETNKINGENVESVFSRQPLPLHEVSRAEQFM